MNSIRKARRRPRGNSYNFIVFKWVLVREATMRVMAPDYEAFGRPSTTRKWLAERSTDYVRALAADVLRKFPERRIAR